MLFIIFITDMFQLMKGTEIYNYADAVTTHAIDGEVKNVTKLEQIANHLATWFPENYMNLI